MWIGTVAAASDTPDRIPVLVRDGGRGDARLLRWGTQGDVEQAALDRGLAQRAARVDFPHVLLGPGARAPRPISVLELLERLDAAKGADGLAAAAMDAPDTLRIAMMRFDFATDAKGDSTTGNGKFDLRTGITAPVDSPPHDRNFFETHAEALRRYYEGQSYGTLHLEFTVFPLEPESAYSLSDMGDYGPWVVAQSDRILDQATRLVEDAVATADASGEIDFSAFGGFVLIHAGADVQGDINRDSPYDIPSFNILLAEEDAVITGDGTRINRVMVVPEFASQDGRVAALNGVYAHESGHILGLPDLYDIFNGLPQVGYFSLMDSGDNIGAILCGEVDDEDNCLEAVFVDGALPSSLDPWSKLQAFPRVNPMRVEETWDGTLDAVQVGPNILLAQLDVFEYFLIENRAMDLDGNKRISIQADEETGVLFGPVDPEDQPGEGGRYEYDALLPARDLDRDDFEDPEEGGGVLIWHIDDKLVIPAMSDRGQVNQGVFFRGVALEEADGVWDQGRFNLGRVEDAFFNGNNTEFLPTTVPGSAANDATYSGIRVTLDAEPLARRVTVAVERPLARAGWPVPLLQNADVQVTPEAVTRANIDGDPAAEFVFVTRVETSDVPRPRWGLAAAKADGTPVSADLLELLLNRPLDGFVTSARFRIATGGRIETVFALADNNGQVHVWDSAFTPRLGRLNTHLASTGPILLDPVDPDGPSLIAHGALGGMVTRTLESPEGVLQTARVASDVRMTLAPVLLPQGGTGEVDLLAGAFEGGVLELFPVDPSLATTVPNLPVVRMGSDIRHLIAGRFSTDLEDDDPMELVIVTDDSVAVLNPLDGVVARWALEAAVALEPAAADIDGDGRHELVLGLVDGTIAAFNGRGSPTFGWPRTVQTPLRDLKVADLDGEPGLDVLVLGGFGLFHGFTGGGRVLADFPRSMGPFRIAGAFLDDLNEEGELTWFAAAEEGVLLATRFPGSVGRSGDWRFPGGRPEGGNVQNGVDESRPGQPDLDGQELIVYPNPAHGDAVQIRYHLVGGESGSLRIYDVNGRELTDARLLGGAGTGSHAGENAVQWDIRDVAPGLYFCRLERTGDSGGSVTMARVAVLR